MAGITRSAKDLWSLVTGSSIVNCKELVQYELGENSIRILNGTLFFNKPDQSSFENLKKSVEENHYEFACKLSKLINVDVIQCYELFVSYTVYEYKGTKETLEAQLTNERHVHSLLLEVWHYYYGERLYYLLILKHILGHWQNESDPYKETFESFMDKNNKDSAVVNKIMSQLESLIRVELPTKDTHGQYMSDLLTYHWITFTLKEQCELLQLLLLYYKDIQPSVVDVQKMFSIFQSHGFGLRQSFRLMVSSENQHLINLIGYLEAFVLIQCFELEWLFKCKEKEMIKEHYLFKDENALRALNESILHLGSHPSHSPILLAWLLIAQCSEIPEMSVLRNKLGKTALQLNVFEYLVTALGTSELSGKGNVPEIFNTVVYNLLSGILNEFDMQHLGTIKSLISIAVAVLKYKSTAKNFWETLEDSGIGELFSYCVDIFSVEFSSLLNICSSLVMASKESCQKVIEKLKQLPVYSEYLENIQEKDITATEEPGVWQLIRNRMVYGDSNIVIPTGTLGIVLKDFDKNSSSIMQWKINVNGWQICLRELYLRLQDISLSSAYIDREGIQKITAACKLVNNILEVDCEHRFLLIHIINLIFSILQRYVQSTSPCLELIATCINIAATLSKEKRSDVWQQLIQIRLFPYMTSVPKTIPDLLSGICMNTGIIGELIISKECVAGEYSVCSAFLKLISNVSQNVPEDDENFLACVIYVLREIFSSFHKWYYVDNTQRLHLGQQCLRLLHNIFLVDREKMKNLGRVQELCIYCLLNFEAGQTLLKVVCTGEDVIQQTILKQNSDFGNQVASMIQLSFSVLNRLLLLRNYIKGKSTKSEVSPLEAVLFSTPGHVNEPQVVLTVAYYAFQHYNPNLAILAIQLLKRFAKFGGRGGTEFFSKHSKLPQLGEIPTIAFKLCNDFLFLIAGNHTIAIELCNEFPMSLLACFGTEAESIRDHFLTRLKSRYESIRLKVSILEFLTVCVAQQPGLIEMFINVCKKDDYAAKDDEQSKSCLECVKGILKNRTEQSGSFLTVPEENFVSTELLCAAVEFIHALWAGHQALAMEALKEDPQFWKLTSSHLLHGTFSGDSPAINAYIIRTLALEVFYNEAVRNGLNEQIKAVFAEIQHQNLLQEWSKLIHQASSNLDQAETTQIFDSTSVDFHASFALLTAWRDFLLIIAVYKPIEISSSSRKQLLSDILDHFCQEMTSENPKPVILLSELFLMLSQHWQNEFIELACTPEGKSPIFTILNHVAMNADSIHPREQLVVVCIAVFAVRVLEIRSLKEWILPTLQLLKTASVLIHQSLNTQTAPAILKLPIAIIHLFNVLVEEDIDWLPIVKTHAMFPVLVSLLMKSLKLETGVELSHSILTLFMSISTNKQAADSLVSTGFISEVTLILFDVNLNKEPSEKRKCGILSKTKLSQVDVYFSYVRLMTMLLRTLGNYFLHDCLNFIGVHQEIIQSTLSDMRSTLLQEKINEAILTSTFILHLSSYYQTWQLEHAKSFQMLFMNVCNCLHNTIAILCKPDLLKYLIMNKKLPDSKLSPLKMLETESLLKKPSIEDESRTVNEFFAVQQKLFELLAVLLSVLKKYSPELCETMSGYVIDYGQWHLFLNTKFGTPSVDQEGPLSFGTILACVNMCLKTLVKNEKSPSPRATSDSSTQIDRHLLMYILENSLTILLSQSNVALSHPGVSPRDKQVIRRDLAAELHSVNITVNRYLRKGPPSPAGVLSAPGFSRIEYPFLKLISNLVDKVFK